MTVKEKTPGMKKIDLFNDKLFKTEKSKGVEGEQQHDRFHVTRRGRRWAGPPPPQTVQKEKRRNHKRRDREMRDGPSGGQHDYKHSSLATSSTTAF